MSQRFRFAEGWRRHAHVGFTRQDCNPLADILGASCMSNPSASVGRQEMHTDHEG
jgi:hypothetical protein